MDFAYFKNNYRVIAADLSKQKALDADSRAIQQIAFTGKIKSIVANAKVITTFLNDHKKRYYIFLKEQQKFCEKYV